jgi:1A family penicillin-binding protein
MRRRLTRIPLALFALAVVALAALYAWLAADLPSVETIGARGIAPSSRVLDRHGRLLYEIADPQLGRHTSIPLAQMPDYLKNATIATEDANFYSNPGVDAAGVLRALWINLQGGDTLAGGSTITQQVARNLLLDAGERNERTLRRKLRESILAWQLTGRYSKDQILELYLNETYYGHLAYGVEAAARAYFGKPASDLDLAESALLAGLPQSPVLYDPLIDPDAATARQAVVLDLLAKRGTITEEQARQARAEQLHFAAEPFPIQAPHFVIAVWAQLERELGADLLYHGGLTITTTLDLDWQITGETILRRRLEQLNQPDAEMGGHNAHNGALVAIDPHTGEVLVMVGSPDYFDPKISGAVNAALAPRQPGSSIKPLTYAAAFTPRPGYTPLTAASLLLDVRTTFVTAENTPYVPQNYDYHFHGPVLARTALAASYNIPAVRALQYVGIDRLLETAQATGITTLDPTKRYGLALTLGGGEVRLLELTAAYGAFATGGRRVAPVLVREIRDRDGRPVALPAPAGQGEQVLDPRVAYLITDILSDDQARAPSFGAHSLLELDRPAAAKTGTTGDYRDNWTVGYTPDLAAGVWVGNADNSPMRRISGISGAAPAWHDFMEAVLLGQPATAFTRPPGLTEATVCALSGLKPTPYCALTRTELFIAGTEPTQPDTFYRPYRIDLATGGLAGPDTPPARVVERVFVVLPPEAEDWARAEGLPRPPDGVAVPVGGTPAGGAPGNENAALALSSPDGNSVWHITATLPPEAQKLRVAARAGVPLAQVTLLVDGAPLAVLGAAPYEALWTLAPGTHTFQAVGTGPDGQHYASAVVTIEVKR